MPSPRSRRIALQIGRAEIDDHLHPLLFDPQRTDLREAGGINPRDRAVSRRLADRRAGDLDVVAGLHFHHVLAEHVGLDLQLREPADSEQHGSGGDLPLVADCPLEHHAVDGAFHLSALFVFLHLLERDLGLGFLFFEHVASERFAADVFGDRLGQEERGRLHRFHRGQEQFVLPHLDLALNLGQASLLVFVFRFGLGLHEAGHAGEVLVVVVEFGAGGVDRAEAAITELCIDSTIFSDCSSDTRSTLASSFSLIEASSRSRAAAAASCESLRSSDDLSHDFALLDRSPLDAVDRRDPAIEGHRDRIDLRQAGLAALVDEFLNRACANLGRLDRRAAAERADAHGNTAADDDQNERRRESIWA